MSDGGFKIDGGEVQFDLRFKIASPVRAKLSGNEF
jgi:hypothetical protein